VEAERVSALLEEVARGETDPAAAARQLAWLPVEALGSPRGVFARVDHHRAFRQGQPEVVFGQGKTPGQVLSICRSLAAGERGFLVTRLEPEAAGALSAEFPDVEVGARARVAYLPPARRQPPSPAGPVLVLSAGTADEPVVEEVVFTCRALNDPVREVRDVGVAGLHRLLDARDAFDGASVAIVVAGMEGALPSVVGGLVDIPVVGVPTSVGYGAALGGLTALFAMLTSCAAGITVVNVDNGFGAAAAASRIRRQIAGAPHRAPEPEEGAGRPATVPSNGTAR
jgi:hypothetical protein